MVRFTTAEEAVQIIQSHNKVFIHSVAAAPRLLIEAMVARASELRDVQIFHLHTEGMAPYASHEISESFRVHALFIGANVRKAVQEGRADYIPVFLSEVPLLFRRKVIALDIALVQVSPPDAHGYCSLGISVDTSLAAVQTAKYVIAQVNPNMPRTHGDGHIHYSKFHAMVWTDEELYEVQVPAPNEIEMSIGKHVAELVSNGATLQMGIGAIPNAVLAALTNHKKLGVHTEMFSDGVIDLVERGVITNELKNKHRNKITSGFVMGTKRLYNFIHDNPGVSLLDIAYVNDTRIIRSNPKVTAINSAIEVDVTGQVCADSIGTNMYSGVGGQMDFIRGASLCEDGKPIIALPSVTSKGESRIMCCLKHGAGVVTTRAHVHYIVTEYGAVNLYGKNMRDRAKLLVSIAHPNHRETIAREVHEQYGFII